MFWKKKNEFPCSSDKCLVRPSCTSLCDKVIKDEEKLRDYFLKHGRCPDCGSESFLEGPSGGMSTNAKCAGCDHCFNIGLPLFVQRIGIDKNGRSFG